MIISQSVMIMKQVFVFPRQHEQVHSLALHTLLIQAKKEGNLYKNGHIFKQVNCKVTSHLSEIEIKCLLG